MSSFSFNTQENRMPAEKDGQAFRAPSVQSMFTNMDRSRLGEGNSRGYLAPGNLDQLAFVGSRRSLSGFGTQLGRSLNSSNPVDAWNASADAPWNPVTLSRPDETRASAFQGDFRSRNMAYPASYGGYRDGTVMSDCDSNLFPASDSGYASGARHSVGNPSIHGDFEGGHDTQSINENLAQIHLRDSGSQLSQVGERHRTRSLYNYGGGTQFHLEPSSGDSTLWCHECNRYLKTNSEKRKHIARHTKPHYCDVPGCDRTQEGFSTKNDLERHRKSKHASGMDGYRCTHDQCSNKSKIWPRLDNFKTHLKKVHRVDVDQINLETYSVTTHDASHMSNNLAGLGMSLDYPLISEARPRSVILPSAYVSMERSDHLPTGSVLDSEDPLASQHFRTQGVQLQLPSDHSFCFSLSPETPDQQAMESIPRTDQTDQVPPEKDETQPRPIPIDSDRTVQIPSPQSPLPDDGEVASDTTSSVGCDSTDPRPANSLKQTRDAPSSTVQQQLEEEATGSDTTDKVVTASGNAVDKISEPLEQDPGHEDLSGDPFETQENCESPPTESLQLKHSPGEEKSADAASVVTSKKADALADLDANTLGCRLRDLDDRVLEEALKSLGYEKSKPPPTQPAQALAPPLATGNSNATQCSECSRTFGRPSELKKHMKRHSKPYGCTFPQCDKRFGSKNDWKRHETSQHIQKEAWRCNEKAKDDASTSCGAVCYSRDSLQKHLQHEHKIEDDDTVNARLERCRFGNGCEDRFWCGFCKDIIEITLKHTGGALSKRYDHIDDHIWGRNGSTKKAMSEWQHVDLPQAGSPRQSSEPSVDSGSSQSNHSDTPSNKAHERVPRSGGKRQASGDGPPGSKKPKHDTSGKVWFCCQCNEGGLLCPLTNACVNTECLHRRCGSCKGEERLILTKGDDSSSADSQAKGTAKS